MGWRGTLIHVAAAARRMEQEAARQQRAAEKRAKLLLRFAEQERAKSEAGQFEEELEELTSVHKECGEEFDWPGLYEAPEPSAPDRQDVETSAAQAGLDCYKPTFLDRLLRRQERKRRALEETVASARQIDQARYQARYDNYLRDFEAWNDMRQKAWSILQGDNASCGEFIQEVRPFVELEQKGCKAIQITLAYPAARVTLDIAPREIVPTEAKSCTAAGKLSIKKIPQTRQNQIYQDYVCGCALRVGRELFALLPLESVVANIRAPMLNPQNGYVEETAILAVAMRRQTVKSLNFAALDPSEAMRNFIHRMEFNGAKGFQKVEPLSEAVFDGG